MLNQDYTAKLLNLEDVIITNVENISGQLHISLELPRVAHICPACGGVTDVVHDYRMQTIKDMSRWQEIPFCTCASVVIAAPAASVSSRKTISSPATLGGLDIMAAYNAEPECFHTARRISAQTGFGWRIAEDG